MKYLKNKIIKHKNFMDVCCRVLSIYEGSKNYKLKVAWINQAFIESFDMNEVSKIEIPKNRINDWAVCQEPNKKCLRDSGWSYLK